MIIFDDVTKQFPDGTRAVDGFNLTLPAHKTTVLQSARTQRSHKDTLATAPIFSDGPGQVGLGVRGAPHGPRFAVRCVNHVAYA